MTLNLLRQNRADHVWTVLPVVHHRRLCKFTEVQEQLHSTIWQLRAEFIDDEDDLLNFACNNVMHVCQMQAKDHFCSTGSRYKKHCFWWRSEVTEWQNAHKTCSHPRPWGSRCQLTAATSYAELGIMLRHLTFVNSHLCVQSNSTQSWLWFLSKFSTTWTLMVLISAKQFKSASMTWESWLHGAVWTTR